MNGSIARTLIAALSFPIFGLAQTQSNTGQIDGFVRDKSGAPLAGAFVSIRNLQTNFARELETTQFGSYRAPALPIGEYDIEIRAAGFARYHLTGIALSTGQSFALDHRMENASPLQTILLRSESPLVETAQSSSSQALKAIDIQNLPNLARNELQFALLQPFINANRPREYESLRFDIGGLARRVNFQIDGFENSTSQQKTYRITRLGPTSVNETQILTFGANAEYGRSAGGVINNISRSGSNLLRGQIEYLLSRAAFNATPYQTSGAVKPSADIGAFGIGGPLRRDRLFLFLSAETSQRAFPSPLGFTDPEARAAARQLDFSAKDTDILPSSFNPKLWLIRLDYQPSLRHSLLLRANTYREANTAQFPGGTTVLSSSSGGLTNTYAAAASWTWLISPALIQEFRAQIADRYFRRMPYTKPSANILPATVLSGVATFGYPNNLTANREEIQEFSDNLSYSRSGHLFKSGINFVQSPVFYEDGLNPVFLFAGTETSSPVEQYLGTVARAIDPETGQRFTYSQLALSFGRPRLDYTQSYFGAYLQDSWRLRPDLTLNIGLRYEAMIVPQAPADAPHVLSRKLPNDRLNFAPRVGVAWSPRRSSRTAIRASYGVHYDAPQGNAFRDSLIDNSVTQVSVQIAGDSRGAPPYPFYPRVLSGLIRTKASLSVMAPDFQWMYAHQAQVAVVHAVSSDLSVSIQYAFLKGTKIPVTQNVNLNPASPLLPLPDGRPVYTSSRLDPDFNNILMLTSAGNSNYNGVGIHVTKRMRRYLQLNAAYTWSHALDNAPELGISGGSEQPQDTYNRRGEYGNAISDVRHVFNASSVLRWRSFQVSNFFFARSGTTYDIRAGADLNHDTNPNDRPLFVGRNAGKGPASMQLDARVSRFFRAEKLGPRSQLEVFGESANVLNSPIPDSTNAFLNRTSFTILSWHEMRRVELGFRLLF